MDEEKLSLASVKSYGLLILVELRYNPSPTPNFRTAEKFVIVCTYFIDGEAFFLGFTYNHRE